MAKQLTLALVIIAAALFMALALRGGEVLTALAVSTTNTSAVTVNVSQGAPYCAEAICYDADYTTDYIDLEGGNTRLVTCNATCNDENGEYDLVTFQGQIQTGGSGLCAADTRSCYVNSTCQNATTGNGTAQRITCSYLFWFHADNTSQSGDWIGNVSAADTANQGAFSTDTIDVQALLALGVTPILSFGAKNAGVDDATVGAPNTVNIYNYGNVQLDFKTNGTSMPCSIANSIPSTKLRVNLSNGGDYSGSYPLNATLCGPDVKGDLNCKFDSFNLAESSDSGTPNPSTSPTYWGIGLPTGVKGDCSGTIWFAAVFA